MARIRADFVAGALDAALAAGGTSMSSPALADLPVVASPDVAAISLYTADTNGRITKKEIVHVTAHTAAATTATITRGRETTTDQAWSSGDKWEHAATKEEWARYDCKVYRATAYSFPNVVDTAIPWDGEEFDNGGFHDNVTNNTRLTVPAGQGGLYVVGYALNSSEAIADQKRFLGTVQKNGVALRGSRSEIPTSGTSNYPGIGQETQAELAAADYVEVVLYHNAGAAKAADTALCAFWLRKVA